MGTKITMTKASKSSDRTVEDLPNEVADPGLDAAELAAAIAPIEIPWRLLGTTGVSVRDPGDRDFAAASGSSLSVFHYEVPEALTRGAYPGKRVVYFKFSVTVTPGRLGDLVAVPDGNGSDAAARARAREVLDWTDPARALLLDVAIDAQRGALDPRPGPAAYFASAMPLSRDMEDRFSVSTGTASSNESTVRTGDSTTQSTEVTDMDSTTTRERSSWGVGGSLFGLVGAGGGGSTTTTTVNVDATNIASSSESSREASQVDLQRRNEGFQTQVTNMLALLRARFVGTENLQFSLRPRPVMRPPRNRTDSDAWYAAQLENLSRGLDGVQDFFGVAIIDTGVGPYTLKVRSRIAHVASARTTGFLEPVPPNEVVALIAAGVYKGPVPDSKIPFTVIRRFEPKVGAARAFLNAAFPPGSSADVLDIDVQGAVNVWRDHVPPAWAGTLVTRAQKPLGQSPITIRQWNLPVVLESEQRMASRQVDWAADRTAPRDVRWAELYAFVVVEWTEWVPYPVDRTDNVREAKNKIFDPEYSGRMTSVVRTMYVPYKPLQAVLLDANLARAVQPVLDPLGEGLAYAESATLELREASKPRSTHAVVVIDHDKPIALSVVRNLNDASREVSLSDAELAHKLAGIRSVEGIAPRSVAGLLVERLRMFEGSVAKADLQWLGEWSGVDLAHLAASAGDNLETRLDDAVESARTDTLDGSLNAADVTLPALRNPKPKSQAWTLPNSAAGEVGDAIRQQSANVSIQDATDTSFGQNRRNMRVGAGGHIRNLPDRLATGERL